MNIDISRLLLVAAAGLLAVGAVVASCNTHPVEYRRAGGAVEHKTTVSGGGAAPLDILWVIDNSLSMCQEQEALRQNFRTFINTLTATPVDFNVAVTTTHFKRQNLQEFIADPGRIQSTPHPPVGFQRACKFRGDNSDGQRDFTPLIQQIRAAVKCAKPSLDFPNLEKWGNVKDPNADGTNENSGNVYETTTQRERKIFRCALPDIGTSSDCNSVGKNDSDFTKADLFPCGAQKGTTCDESQLKSVYREIPLVLKASEYESAGGLDVDRLRRDFACMSFVGTRGSPNEQGLRAAARAVAPYMTGGPAENPFKNKSFRDPLKGQKINIQNGENRPNHGFLRKNAQTAVLFITDENDCSHTGTKIRDLKGSRKCGELHCYFPTKKGKCEPPIDQSQRSECPLITTEKLWKNFKNNLKKSKRLDKIRQNDVIIGSIHGNYRKYSGDIPDRCSKPQRNQLAKNLQVCNTAQRGSARSGSRYGDFMTHAASDNQTIVPENPTSPTTGFMCRQNLSEPLRIIAEKLRRRTQSCIDERVLPCDTGAAEPDCPSFEFKESSQDVCKQWANGSQATDGYCASAIRLQMKPTNGRAVSDLSASARNRFNDLCIQASTEDGTPNSCVVRRSAYTWAPCPGNEANAVKLEWNNSAVGNPSRELAPFRVEARYTESINANLNEGTGPDAGGGS